MGYLSKEDRRRYAKAMRRIEYGVWGKPLSLFRKITLTTRKGDDNSCKRFGKDFRKLIAIFRGLGYSLEYCGVLELSPKNHLLHWHVLFRVKGGYFPITRRKLGDMWNEIHNAFAVDIKNINKGKELVEYINKHMVKSVLNSEGEIRNKFLVSKGWLPGGWSALVSEFKNWWVNGSGDIWMGREGYVQLNNILKRACEAQNTILKTRFGYIEVVGFKVRSAEIYGYEGEGD